jgi:hypothetical protein
MNPRMSDKQWMQRYVFMDLHEIFFGEFPKIMATEVKEVEVVKATSQPFISAWKSMQQA